MQLGMSSKSTLSEQTRFPDDETGEIAKRFAKFTDVGRPSSEVQLIDVRGASSTKAEGNCPETSKWTSVNMNLHLTIAL